MTAVECAMSQHFLVAAAAEQGVVEDYLEACHQAHEPAVIVRLGPPTSLTVHLEPTGKRLSEDRGAGLEQLLRGLSAPGAIVLAGPAAGRSDWLRPDFDPNEAAGQVVAFLAETQPEQLAQPAPMVEPVHQLRPKQRSFNQWLNDTVDSISATLELLEEIMIRRIP